MTKIYLTTLSGEPDCQTIHCSSGHARASESEPGSVRLHQPSQVTCDSVRPHDVTLTMLIRSLELAARRLGRAGWSAVVTVLLVEGREMLAMDEEGTSDPYCKFRLGGERYKTKTVYETLDPKWQEQFELYLYEDQGQDLDITVWDKDQRSKDDFMGRWIKKQDEGIRQY